MRSLFSLVLTLFICLPATWAQSSLPPVYEIRTDSAVSLDSGYFQVLEDPTGAWTLEQVSADSLSGRFHPDRTRQEGMGFNHIKTYWQRARLYNPTGRPLPLVFTNAMGLARYELFVLAPGKSPVRYLNGANVGRRHRDGFKWKSHVIATLDSGQTVIIYKRITLERIEGFDNASFTFVPLSTYTQSELVNIPPSQGDIWKSLIAGILLLGFFLYYFFYRAVRERVYLYFALVLLLEGAWFFFRGNSLVPSIWFIYLDISFFNTLFFWSVVQFIRHLLQLRQSYPRFDRVLGFLSYCYIPLYPLAYLVTPELPYAYRATLFIPMQLVHFLMMLGSSLAFFLPRLQKDRFFTLSMAGALPSLLLWCFGYGSNAFFQFRTAFTQKAPPEWAVWLRQHQMQLEIICLAVFMLLFSWILVQRFSLIRQELARQALQREKEKAELIAEQNERLEREVQERTADLQRSLQELKTAQAQLVHAEKMASLGELTAGIAHEIQNPLNFVNNFSELNKELGQELKEELAKGNWQLAKELADNIISNEEKINHHGKRADSIVKGMLQHSRSSSGQKEPADINALCDEYLRLAYHGLRAKDKSFNANFETELDPAVGLVSVLPQDLGRVILNLINNAFYAVSAKALASAGGSYVPTVKVITRKVEDRVEIKVEDNGTGIPQKVIDKIFQPFFTTKPTGEGTGLGLSLSYDIIKKGHGGELSVQSREGEGTTFTIQLPA